MIEDQNIIVGLNIDVTDKNDLFELHHYRECDVNSDFYVKECRGLIYDNNKALVCKTFSFTPEKLWSEPDVEAIVNQMIQQESRFYPSYEGTILRLFFYQDKWYITTHKKLDAFKSRWGSEVSFGDYFVNCLMSMITKESLDFSESLFERLSSEDITRENIFDRYCQLLDKDFIYTFLIRTCNKNRVVCKYDSSKLFFVGGFKKEVSNINNIEQISFNYYNEDKINSYVHHVPSLNIDSYQDFVQTIETNKLDIKNEWLTQGYVVIDKSGYSIKFLNPEYQKWIPIRGNNPILLQRYIELKKMMNFTFLTNFISLYSDIIVKVGNNELTIFDDFERVINNIKNNLFFHYKKRYVYKQKSVVPPEQHQVLIRMFEIYVSNPTQNKLSQSWVNYILDSLDIVTLYNLYKQFKWREVNYGNGNKINEQLVNKVDAAYYKNNNK